MASTIALADIGKWPRQVVHQYHKGIVDTIRVTVKTYGPAIIQAIIDGVRPHPPVNTGDYRRSWKARNITDGVFFYNPTLQASIIERGRRPAWVSKEGQEALARWVHLHGMDREPMSKRERRVRRRMRAGGTDKGVFRFRTRWQQENRARGIAFVIARAMSKKARPGLFILAQTKRILTMQVTNDVEAMIARGPQP